MSIKAGFAKIRDYLYDDDGQFILQSLWTNANTVEFDDGKTLQDKLGTVKGVTSTREAISSSTVNGYIPTSLAVKNYVTNALTAKQDAKTAITTSNIGLQTVSKAKVAESVSWANIANKPESFSGDVPDWAKADTKPAYNYSEIQNSPTFRIEGTTLYINF